MSVEAVSISEWFSPGSSGCRFPLFTKGVETYRFEYGVYLLNKDIELVRRNAATHCASSRNPTSLCPSKICAR